MSRVKALLIAVILVVGILFPTTALASPGATVSITDATLPTGASGSVALSISGISADRPVSCITVDVNYEPSVVEVLSVSGGDFSSLVDNIQNTDGYTRLVAYVTSETGLTGTIKVADITLTRLGGESELALDVITLKDDDGNPIPFTIDNGWVTADGAPPVDDTPPTVTSTSPTNGATGVAITATVRATFSEVIDSGTLAFSVGGVSGTTTYTGTTATFTLGANLGYSRTYTASVSASDLAGNPMAVAYSWSFTTAAAPAAGGGGGGFGPTYYTQTNLFGTEESYRISSSGKILETIEATSADGNLTLTISKDTIALDKDGNRLGNLEAAVDKSPPDPPKDAHLIGPAYDFGPDGATFDPAITFVWSYDPEALPEDVAEGDLALAYYDEADSEWVELDGAVDTEDNTITAYVDHFTTFAIIGAVTPPPPEPAAFTPGSLSVSPTEVDTGEAVGISISVANTGGQAGSYTVTLKINGVVEETREVTVAAGASETVTFTTSGDKAGTYAVDVNGLTGSFTVNEAAAPPPPPPSPVNWPVLLGIIAAVVALAAIVLVLLRRQHD